MLRFQRETAELIEEALGVCLDTGGAFDISVAPITGFMGILYQGFPRARLGGN